MKKVIYYSNLLLPGTVNDKRVC